MSTATKVVILIHIITYLFRIGLRQTVGFIEKYLEQIGKILQIISYSQASRRFKKLNIKINDCAELIRTIWKILKLL
ncbi:transposase [Wolbachia endosymbiont of Chrysomya megacephala]|uniref:transposase n=1 Tax=Wolbachia endosymbiont of Chrysomya megacephala TaxID=1335053 RepID=UPI001FE8F8A4|nr:transposase [Wolbachia endosymbiont of Chrysomya megacephala]